MLFIGDVDLFSWIISFILIKELYLLKSNVNKWMKVLFLVFHGLSSSNGISKKIVAQVKAIKDLGLETHLARYEVKADGSRCWMLDEHVLVNFGSGTCAKVRKRIDYNAILHYVIQSQTKFVYIRSDHNANPFTIHLVRSMREFGCRVVMEIPTYPYDQEYIALKLKFNLFWDRCFRHKLAEKLSAIVSFTNERLIFGQKTIGISNGVDFDSIPLRNKILLDKDDSIHLLGVAEIHYWHGFDRVIAGMAQYYRANPSRKVYLHLVGKLSGKREEEEVLLPISKNQLEPYVVMHGPLWGDDLDKMFDQADFAIGSLGRHRSGIDSIRTLKNREYAARGVAFAYSETDSDFDEMDYVMKVLADESPLNIPELLRFIDGLQLSPEEIRNSIGHLSWREQMAKVFKVSEKL
ncbi:MAG: hypothetical protein H6Q14_1094 [Bacteroidetes bacterium]|nr:hypothetical protein [Bacteroidota bacterium]